MPLFREIDWTTQQGGQITTITADSLAAEIGLQAGDILLAVSDTPVQDVIDVHYYTSDESFELLVRRGEEYFVFEVERAYGQQLGIEFAHPTFDTDIRRCNNLCEFCFVLQMAPKFRRTLYIKDDDYRYSFLFGHFVTLTNLTEHDWWRIEAMRLSPLYVSVHVTDSELRRRFLRNQTAPDIMTQLRWLADRGIEVHTQLVVVPEFNDGPWLERSVKELSSLWPAVQSISVVPVGLTRQHKYGMRTHTKEEAAATLNYIESLQPFCQVEFGSRFVYPTDEWYIVSERDIPPLEAYDGQQLHENGLGMVRHFLDEWQAVQQEILHSNRKPLQKYQTITLVTGTLFAPILRRSADAFAKMAQVQVHVLPVINERLGGTITAAGLLMGQDIIQQAQGKRKSDLFILPRVTFDHPDTISLDDLTPLNIAEQLQCPVALADTMGDVWDALTGQSQVLFDPSSNLTLKVLPDKDVTNR